MFLEWRKVTDVRETIVITLTKLLLSKSMIIVKAYFKNITQSKAVLPSRYTIKYRSCIVVTIDLKTMF